MQIKTGRLEMLNDYQIFADSVQQKLNCATHWQKIYAGYATALLANRERVKQASSTFLVPKPLQRYITIGEAKKLGGALDFDLRYLGQSVGRVRGEGQSPKLIVSEQTAKKSEIFGYTLGAVEKEDWQTGNKAVQFRAFYKVLLEHTDTFPRHQECMVESALFSELGKPTGDTKQLKFIQPISYGGVRLHMKTALNASDSANNICEVAGPGAGGDIDLFCRRRCGNRNRLTVIEVKDENISQETFHLAIKQAIAYAVFIRELARSESGRDWMELWGLGNQPWEKGFTINAVAAMPIGETSDFGFARHTLTLGQDKIELHYLAFLGADKPRDGQDMRFKTSL